MDNEKKAKNNILKLLLLMFIIYFVGFSWFFANKNLVLDTDRDGLVEVDYIHSETQRLSKLELENIMDDDLIEILDNAIARLFLDDSKIRYFSNDPEMVDVIKIITNEWDIYRQAILEFRENDDRDAMFVASENLYDNLEFAISKIKIYIDESSNSVQKLQTWLICNIVVMVLLLLKLLSKTATELKENKELSKDMFIDMATGVYNSAKCKEILKLPIDASDKDEVAILIFDLNDLKKTNDLYGHQAGDALISSFVDQLNKATEIFKSEPFIGRYGGDEFVAYFESTTKDDVEEYIEKVNYLMKSFNEEEERNFKISCAVGYSITTPENKATITMQQLFDIADDNMYHNKIAMKEKRRKEMEEQT